MGNILLIHFQKLFIAGPIKLHHLENLNVASLNVAQQQTLDAPIGSEEIRSVVHQLSAWKSLGPVISMLVSSKHIGT